MIYSYYDKKLDSSVKGLISFALKKIRKLYLLHIIMTLFALLLLVFMYIDNFSWDFLKCRLGEMLLNILLIQDWFPNASVYFSMNAVAWYLSLCLFLYLSFPLVLKFIRKIGSIKYAIIISCLIYCLQCFIGFILQNCTEVSSLIDNFSKWIVYICPLFRLGDFMIGACWGYIFINAKKKINIFLASLIEIFIVLLIPIIQYVFDNQVGILGGESFRYNMLYTCLSVSIIYMFAINKGIISKSVSCKFLLYIGNISPYAFLIHQIVIRYIEFFNNQIDLYIKTILALILTIVFSEIYKIMETIWINSKFRIYVKESIR